PMPRVSCLIFDQRIEPHSIEFLASIEKRQFDDGRRSRDGRVQFANQRDRCGECAAGGEDVIDDQHAIAFFHGVIMNFERVTAIFEDVLIAALRPRKLAWLTNGNEARAKNTRDATTENESARLDAGDRGDLVLEKRFGESL